MTLVLGLSLLFLSVHVRAQLNQSNVIVLGSPLSPIINPTSWSSPSGRFAFGFYPQGNGFAVGIRLLGHHENTSVVVWTAIRDHPPVSANATLELTTAGRLILRTEQVEMKLIANVSKPADSASMLDSGNFVLYAADGDIIWQTFDFPTDTLLYGQNLTADNNLISSLTSSDHSSGRFLLVMQAQGNLVAYPTMNPTTNPFSIDAYWSTGTNGYLYNQLSLASLDGRCSLYLQGYSEIHPIANCSDPTVNETIIHRATLDADGIFRLYSHHFQINTATVSVSNDWSILKDQCGVKGFCGFNSYCASNTGGNGRCYCYPGFVWLNQSCGCAENYTGDICMANDPKQVEIHVMQNMWLDDFAYFKSKMDKEDCGLSCQEDCNCWAAVYEGDKCRKFTLPLRYGRRELSSSSIAFIKIIKRISEPNNLPYNDDGLIKTLAVVLGITAVFSFILVITASFIYWDQRQSYRKILSANEDWGLTEELIPRSFDYGELETATNGFREELGRGNYGAVYKGSLQFQGDNNRSIAVKRLEKVSEEGEREFRAEISTIGRTHHRNLVKLLGFCVDSSKKLLVYEFVSNGSLADYLLEHHSWDERLRIAHDIARGILYLHEECEVRIIHSNIKPQNILIDDSATAKISDFGFAKLVPPIQVVSETRSYLAPECYSNSSLVSEKADIFSFGVVLLEIICNRSITVTEGQKPFSNWVHKDLANGGLDKLVEGECVDSKCAERMVNIGLWCTHDDPDLRPSMKRVILMLEGTLDVPVPPLPALGKS
ncbi:hypothetical protein K2173_012087 [Erythroxylum novogranatense]|uniref:Receptor-like serine/threonine-protein kinase n=1 Tax=Erythroxylum novogranatense TaxID=1862640 RepID=A0AAV8TH52_9ROSI|nr:hypothetical protein K2173_012087 [Erythroxylum novogranatense]